MTQPENPPAFPHNWKERTSTGGDTPRVQYGMLLRDYAAIKLAAALVAGMSKEERIDVLNGTRGFARISRAAHEGASAMLAERAKDGAK